MVLLYPQSGWCCYIVVRDRVDDAAISSFAKGAGAAVSSFVIK